MGLTLQPGTKDLERRKKNKRRLIRSFSIGFFCLGLSWLLLALFDVPTWWVKILVIVSILWVLATYVAFRVVWNPKVK